MKINPQILKKCREQMCLSQEDVKKKVSTIAEIENSNKEPTPNQLTTLGELYHVPRWVFIANKLPLEYQYDNKPTFRKLKLRNSTTFKIPKVRQLISKVEQYRRLFLELKEDINEPIPKFSTKNIPLFNLNLVAQTAKAVRKWLKLNNPLKFDVLREKLEQQNIFIFMTSKYKGWSQIDINSFRGLSIFHDTLPIIIINDSDFKKAQSFTLFHELGHLLKKHTSIGCNNVHNTEEKWCDKLAGCILMPDTQNLRNSRINNLTDLKKIAKHYKVSNYSCLVRLKQLRLIDQKTFSNFETQLNTEYRRSQEQYRNDPIPIRRNIIRETNKRFGNSFVRTVIHSMNDKELTLHKASQILDIKRPSQILDLENKFGK